VLRMYMNLLRRRNVFILSIPVEARRQNLNTSPTRPCFGQSVTSLLELSTVSLQQVAPVTINVVLVVGQSLSVGTSSVQ
jgi:hypothetical protein